MPASRPDVEIAGERSLTTMEDPIEAVVPGVAQSQVNLAAGLTLESGLKSLLRQDPEVIAIGEIRDKGTAEIALQAALTGHLILTTFHAGSASEVIGRFLDMGIEPYVVRSGLHAVVAQRLVRRLCDCSLPSARTEDFLGLPVRQARLPQGCTACRGTGYQGRTLLAEMLVPESDELVRAILSRSDVRFLERLAIEAGMIPLVESRLCGCGRRHDIPGRDPRSWECPLHPRVRRKRFHLTHCKSHDITSVTISACTELDSLGQLW